jgi:predicted transposase YdaD
MKTDTQLYKLFSELPEYFFDLTGIHYSARYTLTSETVKEFSRSMDGLMKPDNPDNPYFVVEFQMQKDDTIYCRTVMEMAAIGIKHQQNTYYGIIIFADKTMDPVSEPWSSLFIKNSPALQVFYFDELLKSLKEKEPGHPLLAVFHPYLQKDQLILEKEAADYYNQIQRCSISEDMKKTIVPAGRWILN